MIELFHTAYVIPDVGDLNQNRLNHLEFALSNALIDGAILEFGVHKGTTINFISSKFPQDKIYGFDSFEGLPEDWDISYNEKFNKHKKGYFAVDNLPNVNNNVILVKGFFNDSLIPWLSQSKKQNIKFLHIDSDLYSSANYVLTTLNEFIVPGTIIVFDEFYPWGRKRYETWEEHEYKAFIEWVLLFDRKFEVLSRNTHQQCAIKVIR